MDTGFIRDTEAALLLSALRDEQLIRRCRMRAAELDRADGLPPAEDIDDFARIGLLAAPLPREMGGFGWGTEPDGALPLYEALRLVGRISLPLGRLYEGHVNAVRLATHHADAAGRSAIVAAVRDGQLFGVWNTESPEVSLRIGNDRLRGGKVLCSGLGLVRRALVTARRAEAGPQQMLLVPLDPLSDRANLSAWTVTGMCASATGRIDLDGIALSECLILGGDDDYQAQPDFSGGAWRFLAVHLGGIEAVVEELRAHLLSTGRGEDPHQAARLGTALTLAETARLWTRSACCLAERPESDPEHVVAYVNLARGAVERAALEVMELAQRSVGLQAFLRPHPLERIVRDLATYLRQPAPDRALTAGAAAGLAFPEAVGDMWP